MKNSPALRPLAQSFIEKINSKKAVIGVVGMGYVGLPLMLGYNKAGFEIIGVDIDPNKMKQLASKKSYISHIADTQIEAMVDSGMFQATTDFAQLSKADAILLCVPTPLGKHREPDLSYVEDTARQIVPYLTKGQIVILESTTFPGTTTQIMQPILEEGSGLKGDEDFVVAYSPEREDPGNPDFDTSTIPKVVGAATKEGLDMALALYSALVPKVVPVSSPETAEAVKLTENIFRAVNIAMVNELKVIFDDMGIDVWEVIDAAATKPFGFTPFYPGPGLGGHCIPIDPFYLTWKAREHGRNTRFIELAGEINQEMPKYVVQRLTQALSEKQEKAVYGAKILIAGLAYKKNIDDVRESPSLMLMELLEAQGAKVDFHDPYVPVLQPTRKHPHFTGRKSVPWTAKNLASYDVVLIATGHDNIDWQLLADHGQLIIDTRNALTRCKLNRTDHIVKA